MISYLALGDSYTIGEGVALFDSYPYQLVQQLRSRQISIQAPEVLAKTGWTTDELLHAMDQYQFLPSYDLVTLLIGVNNQYRGRSVETFLQEFTALLRRATQLAKDPGNVAVLSIPDWGLTPFAQDRNRQQIALEIDQYNAAVRHTCLEHQIAYLDITDWPRHQKDQSELVTADGLHPSPMEYKRWSAGLVSTIFDPYNKSNP